MRQTLVAVALLLTLVAPLHAQSVAGIGGSLADQAITSQGLPLHGIRNTPFVVLRDSPELASKAVCTLDATEKLWLLERLGDWVKVKSSKGTGYMRLWYFDEYRNNTLAVEKGFVPPVTVSGVTSPVSTSPPSTAVPTAPVPTTGSNPTADAKPGGSIGSAQLSAADFGFDPKRYQPVFDLVGKFCEANAAYVMAKGHSWTSGFPSRTDCSGFTGSFYQKLAALSGVKPAFGQSSWFPTSQVYKSQYTTKISAAWPPPNPRDLIHPGDIFVLDKANQNYGHVGVFMGYDKSGNPVIAHSTPTTINTRTGFKGNVGMTGVRVEVLPTSSSWKTRWTGIYRINGTDQMLNQLAKS